MNASRAGPGLRVQILLALAGVMLVAYVPLFFAVAQVTRGASQAYREEAARALGRAVAAHVGDVRGRDAAAVKRTLESHIDFTTRAIAIFDANGALVSSAGAADELAAPPRPYGEAATRTRTRAGARVLDVVLPSGDAAVLVRVGTDEDAARASDAMRGVMLYMVVFAVALLVFAYIALTRAIVRPVEQLARAADRVATGSRALDFPPSAAREIAELGASVRAMAARLLEEEKNLRGKVAELTKTTKSLGETRAQLAGSEHMASVGKLAAGVAHEIGNPIAAIMGMHDLIEDAEIPAEDRADFLRRMRKETERINVVVRDLLDYARPSAGDGLTEAASVRDVVDDTLALVRPQKDWKAVVSKVEIDGEPRVGLAPQRLTQVLLNLLLNAAAAMSARPSGDARSVTVRARVADDRVRIEVEDDGPGVPADLRAKIFDPFVTTKDVGAGTGLGLSVCRGIIEAAGGRIFVDDAYEGGARFVIELPPPAPPPPASSPAVPR